jgi:predicted nuclease of predicted toxin-antitoxin system
MIFLIDNQLPTGLAAHFRAQGLDAKHVSDVGLETASDQQIWDYAKTQGLVIVTKDEDFLFLSSKDSAGPIIGGRR